MPSALPPDPAVVFYYDISPMLLTWISFLLLINGNQLLIFLADFQLHDLEIRVGDNEVAKGNPLCAWFPATIGKYIFINCKSYSFHFLQSPCCITHRVE